MNPTLILSLLKYLKYIPLILNVVSGITDVVEESADGHTSDEKQSAARVAIQSALLAFGITLSDGIVNSLIDSVVALKNALGKYGKK